MNLLDPPKTILTFLLFLFLSGCSLLGIDQGSDDTAVSKNEKSPINLSLSQGYVADTVLHLRVQLELLDEVSADSIYVQLKGLKKGVIKEEQTLPVSNFIDTKLLKAGNKIFIPFTLAIKDLDRFTISCSWGEAGYKLASLLDLVKSGDKLVEDNTDLEIKAVSISELNITELELPCRSGLCSVRVNLTGRVLRGNPDRAVKSVALAYKLLWIPDGEVPPIANDSKVLQPDEKILPFGEEILPKDGFEFKVDGDKDLPKIPGGRFMPVVRILRYEPIVGSP